MLNALGRSPLSQMSHDEVRLILFYKIISGMTEMPFEGILNEALKDTRTKQNKKLRKIGHSISSMVKHFPLKI